MSTYDSKRGAWQTYITNVMNDPRTGTLKLLRDYHNAEVTRIQQNASLDGERGYPDPEEDRMLTSHIINQYRIEAKDISSVGRNHLTAIRDTLEKAKMEIKESPLFQKMYNIESRESRKIAVMEEGRDRLKEETMRLKENFDYVCRDQERKTGTTNGIELFMIYPLIYVFLISTIAVFDAKYTRDALLIYNLDLVESWVIAGIVAIAVGGLCHFAGQFLKRKMWIGAFLCLLVLGPLAIAPAYVRHDKAQASQESSLLIDDFGDTADPFAEKEEEDTKGTDALWWIFSASTIALILCGVILAYLKADSSDEFEKNYLPIIKKVPKLNKQIEEANRRINALRSEKERDIADSKKRLPLETHDKIEIYESDLSDANKLIQMINDLYSQAAAYANSTLSTYRLENEPKRPEQSPPPAIWKQEPNMQFDQLPFMSNGILKIYGHKNGIS